jgi:hypothetical protein
VAAWPAAEAQKEGEHEKARREAARVRWGRWEMTGAAASSSRTKRRGGSLLGMVM